MGLAEGIVIQRSKQRPSGRRDVKLGWITSSQQGGEALCPGHGSATLKSCVCCALPISRPIGSSVTAVLLPLGLRELVAEAAKQKPKSGLTAWSASQMAALSICFLYICHRVCHTGDDGKVVVSFKAYEVRMWMSRSTFSALLMLKYHSSLFLDELV